jgi:cytochrome P450
MIGIRDPKHHATRRRPWTRAFNPASIRDYEPTVKGRVKQLVQALMQRESKDVVDLAEWISFFA